MTDVIPAAEWRRCLPLLFEGGVIAIPTDTVYGLAVLPTARSAIERVYEAKGRPNDKALPMLVSGPRQAEAIARLPAAARRLCAAFWPGALTLVVPARRSFRSSALNEDGTVALRMPAAPLALDIIAAAGGVLAVTSANRSGEPPATTARGVLEQLDGRIDAVIDGGPSPVGIASTVVRLLGRQFEVLRPGAVGTDEIRAALHAPAAGPHSC